VKLGVLRDYLFNGATGKRGDRVSVIAGTSVFTSVER
jgi:hypothetical protein